MSLFAFADGLVHGIGFRDPASGREFRLWQGEDLRDALLALATGSFCPDLRAAAPLASGWRPRLPIARPQKILGAGQNYASHAAEMGASATAERPAEPLMFAKLPTSLVASGEPIVIPSHLAGTRIDHEAELAVIVGRPGHRVPVEHAMSLVAGYTIANDITARDLQRAAKDAGRPWIWAKGQDTFCPLGPVVVPAGELDPQALTITCHVNGELRQEGSTGDMIWSVAELLSHASRHTTLLPGDILLTGTPAGVGLLEPGDTVRVEITGIGVLENPVRADD